MPAERYYNNSHLDNDCLITLEGQEHHHLAHVMRGKTNDIVEIVNGRGQLAKASITKVDKRHSSLLITNVHTEPPPQYKLILIQGMPRLNRLETILEKCTELGITDFHLFMASRSEKKPLSENQMERLQTIIISAMKQCGRLFLPKIIWLNPIKQWKNSENTSSLFGDIRPEAPKILDILKTSDHQHISLCIGPEGGLDDQEIFALENIGFKGTNFHHNVLRTDTAAIAGTSILSQFLIHSH